MEDNLQKNEIDEADDVAENRSDDKRDYEFVTETIKKKPINKRKVIQKISYSIGFGLIAGLVACAVFAYVGPKLYAKVNPPAINDDTITTITIPQDDNITEEENVDTVEAGAPNEVNVGADSLDNPETDTNDGDDSDENGSDDTENADADEDASDDTDENDDQNSADGQNQNGDDSENDKTDEGQQGANDGDGEAVEPTVITEIIEKSLEVADYKNLFSKFKEINYNVSKSLATVTLVSDNTDWFMNNYETGNKFSGIILADNGKELLIITNIEKQYNSRDIEVTFCDGLSYRGSIKKFDPNTGLTVVAVNLNRIEESTKNAVTMAELGNSSVSTLVGTPVMAVGAPLAIEGSMQLGLVTSNSHILEYPDSSLRYLTTDMYGSTDGSGVIIDLDGKVVGIIFHGGATADAKNLIRAYGISDIKAKIEKISNGQDLAYLGIVGTDVTPEATALHGVPEGTYVKQVIVDSPAMRGGIRNGDVIVKFGTTDIVKFSEFKEAMLKSQPGDTTVITVKRPGKDEYAEFSYEISLEKLQ